MAFAQRSFAQRFFKKVQRGLGASRKRLAFWALLVLIPLSLSLGWQKTLPADAYAHFAAVENHLVRGISLLVRAPLHTAFLFLIAQVGLPLDIVGLLWSALGWGALSLVLYETGRALESPLGAGLAAVSVTFSPYLLVTLGTELPWALTSFWAAIMFSLCHRPRWADGALALMLFLHPGPVTLAAGLVILGERWRARMVAAPYVATVLWVLVALGWGVAIGRGLLPLPSVTPEVLVEGVRLLLAEYDFYWLVALLIAFGGFALFDHRHETPFVLAASVLWPVLAGFDDALAQVGAGVVALFLAGLGGGWLLQRAQARARLTPNLWLQAGLAFLVITPLALGQLSTLRRQYEVRPATVRALERQAGAWLAAHASSGSTLLASPHVAYRARCQAYLWQADETPLPSEERFDGLPAYIVSSRGLGWEQLQRTVWFRGVYVPVQRFDSPYAASAPVTVWAQRPDVSLPPDARPLKGLLPDHAAWVGYTYDPPQLQPGAPLSVTLYLHLPPLLSATSYPETYRGFARLASLENDTALLGPVPRQGIELLEQGADGALLAEHLVLSVPEDLGVGAYRLLTSIHPYHSAASTSLYVAGEPYSSHFLFLDYLRIPWQGTLEGTQDADAQLGDAIRLVAYELPAEAAPGETVEVRLYWEALATPQDDYTVFVHLLDMEGHGITGHDAKPLGGRYPTQAWVPGAIVPDVHPLTIPADRAPGTVKVQVGMYAWPELVRLPVTLSDGTMTPEATVVLGEIEVR